MRIRFLRTALVAASIMGAVSAFVNAKQSVLTEKKPSHNSANPPKITVKEFVQRMLRSAKDDRLAPIEARAHKLEPLAPIKLLSLTSIDSDWSNKWCDLVLKEGAAGVPEPHCFVLITKRKQGASVSFISYRLNLDGQLESARLTTGRNDDGGRPIHGSAVDTELDASKPEIQKEAAEELRFWLSQQAESSR